MSLHLTSLRCMSLHLFFIVKGVDILSFKLYIPYTSAINRNKVVEYLGGSTYPIFKRFADNQIHGNATK